jgi:hypothetical protein
MLTPPSNSLTSALTLCNCVPLSKLPSTINSESPKPTQNQGTRGDDYVQGTST